MRTPSAVGSFFLGALIHAMSGSASGETVLTGDILQGVPIISRLDLADLEPGKTHRFLFQGVEMGTGQHWYVPVAVVKGAKDGPRVLLAAGVHGDELSPVAVVQRTLAELDPATMSGTVLCVFDLSRPAKEYVLRKWPTNQAGGSLVDFNRVWPGDETGNPPERQAWLLWNRLFAGNVDVVLDFHTAATGSDFTLFIFADYRNPEVRRLAELFPVEQIKDDPGLSGTLETAFVESGVPAITVEVGGPRVWDMPKILACVEGAKNVLADRKVIPGPIGRTSKESEAFFGNDLEVIRSTTGGFTELLVTLNEKVTPGRKVAIQRNAFGDVVAEHVAGVDGEVAILGTDALREPGANIVEILTYDPQAAAGGVPYDGDH